MASNPRSHGHDHGHEHRTWKPWGGASSQGSRNGMEGQGHDSFEVQRHPEWKRRQAVVHRQSKQLIRQYHESPEALLDWIRQCDTPVWIIGGWWSGLLLLFMMLTGHDPGWVRPDSHWSYAVLTTLVCWATGKKATECRHGVFILPKRLCSISYLAHQLHHWMSYRAGLSGYSDMSRAFYRKFWMEYQGQLAHEINKLTLEEAEALQSAIRRDLEALEFVRDMTHDVLIPAGQSRQLAQGSTHA